MTDPMPVNLFVITENADVYGFNPDSGLTGYYSVCWDGDFDVNMQTQPTAMVDWPGTRHNVGGMFSFADGHAEIHKWTDKRTILGFNSLQVQGNPDNPDILWIQRHTTVRADGQ